MNQGPYGRFGGYSPEALSGFVKFHPQYPVLKVPGGASCPPCASRSRLARGCILRASPPRVKGKFGFGRIYCGARADSADPSGFSQLAQSLPRGPCRPSLWRSLHNRRGGGAGTGVPARFPRRSAPPSGRSGRDGKMPLRRDPPRAAPAPPTASCYVQRRCARAAQAMMRRRRESWRRRRIGDMPATAIRQCPRLQSRGKERDARPQRALARRRRQRRRLRAPPSSPKAQGGCTSTADAGVYIAYAKASF